MNKFKYLLLAASLFASSAVFTSCDDGDDDNTANPAEEVVKASKKHDTAILLCTFGSTFKESIKTYDATLADFQNAFPDADIYLSFTSRTCVNRVEAETGIARYQPDLWLQALGNAGYKKVAVQSLHIIPGEEYLSLMNTDVKKKFMIESFPSVQVVKSPCLVYDKEDVEAVAKVLYSHYSDKLALAPFMSIAGDHAHNDLWGIEEDDDFSAAAPNADACWRLKLLKMGFKIDTKESHNGSLENCKIIGLGDYDAVRQIWVNHLKALYNDAEAWETGEDYQ